MSQADVRKELRAHIAKKYKRQAAAAQAWNVSPAFVSMVLRGEKNPNDSMLDAIGFERVETPVAYRRKKKAQA